MLSAFSLAASVSFTPQSSAPAPCLPLRVQLTIESNRAVVKESSSFLPAAGASGFSADCSGASSGTSFATSYS